MFGWLAKALAFFYDVWPSYGGSIVLLTLAIMIVLLPLTLKGTRSMIEMQRLQPEMKKLQNRYKDDRQKLNEELLKFYKENNINPLGGCLPLLIQLPVFWVLYRVLEGLTRRAPFGFDLGGGVATGANHAFQQAGFFHPAYISHSSNLYQNLSHSREMVSWGIDLSQSVTSAFTHGLVHALPYILLLVVVIATTYIQQWQIQSRAAAEANPQQQMLMRFMPLFFAVIYIVIPAGVVVYFLASNLFRIGQQYLITRTMYATPAGGAIPATARQTAPRRSWRSILAPGTEPAAPARRDRGSGGSKRQPTGRQRQKPRQPGQRGGGKSPAGAPGGGRPAGGGGAKRASSKGPQRGAGDAVEAADVDGAAKSAAGRSGNAAERGSRAAPKAGTGRNSRASQQRRQQRRSMPDGDIDEVVTRPAPNGRSKTPSRKSPPPPNRARSKRKRK